MNRRIIFDSDRDVKAAEEQRRRNDALRLEIQKRAATVLLKSYFNGQTDLTPEEVNVNVLKVLLAGEHDEIPQILLIEEGGNEITKIQKTDLIFSQVIEDTFNIEINRSKSND